MTTSASVDDLLRVEDVHVPVALSIYRVAAVEETGRAGAGTFVRYVADDSLAALLPRIDLIVYPHRGASLAQEVSVAHAGLMAFDRRSPAVSATRVDSAGPFPIEATGDTAHRAILYLEVNGRPSRSLLYLHRVAGSFLKVRATYPLRAGTDDVLTILDIVVSALFAHADPAD